MKTCSAVFDFLLASGNKDRRTNIFAHTEGNRRFFAILLPKLPKLNRQPGHQESATVPR